jgi:transcriptional regulator with XRE-family HTH domain
MSGFLSVIRDELAGKEFRDAYVAENARRGLAYQITALREARGWSRAELARQADRPQSNTSRWEDPTYGKYSLSTLIEIAAIFDVALIAKFVSFEELLASVSDLRPSKLAVPSYEEEQKRMASEDNRQMQSGSALAAFSKQSGQQAVSGLGALLSDNTNNAKTNGTFLPPISGRDPVKSIENTPPVAALSGVAELHQLETAP